MFVLIAIVKFKVLLTDTGMWWLSNKLPGYRGNPLYERNIAIQK